ncbi:ribosome small subunit-dependent GTPase A [Ectobacillus polymachus]|uniref:ribosome small subunit-dependent GTPase A n=1 Tax=Ectobacillus polymachus TaxID=1508806 RepID=UPI003A8AE67E
MPQGMIIKALSGFYYVAHEEGITQCRGRGIFRKNKITPLVGDMVQFQADNETEGYILEVLHRRNELVRPPIANVDNAILVFSAVQPDFSTLLLDRFLVLIEFNNIKPIICISKMDLIDKQRMQEIEGYVDDYRNLGYDVMLTSKKQENSIDELYKLIQNSISVVAGQSGVGKSSLLNMLRPELEIKTNDISSHLGRGKHTTRHVELIKVGSGLVADTPGFSSLEFIDMSVEDVGESFIELKRQKQHCKFRGCTHISEPKCTVKEAVEAGVIPRYRYDHYVQFIQEIRDRKPRY